MTAALAITVSLIAVLYASVGHAGATGYIAAMSLCGLDPRVIRPTALVLNGIVATISTVQFCRAGHFSARLFVPLVLASVPCAILGGMLDMPSTVLEAVLGSVLLVSAVRVFWHRPTDRVEDVAPPNAVGFATEHTTPPKAPHRTSPIAHACVGGAIGLLSGLTGVGGGVFLTPVLLALDVAPVKTVAAVTAPFILVNSLGGLAGGLLAGRAMPPVSPVVIAAAVVGGLVGSHLGAFRLPGRTLRILMACVLTLASLKMLAASIGLERIGRIQQFIHPRANALGHAWHVGRLVAISACVLGMHAVNAQSPKEWLVQRKVMIDEDIVKAGIVNQRVVHAMWATPRHEFIPKDQQKYAYFDMALPIGEQQTISPPFIVASMTERLDPTPTDSVLEVGTGSGYQAAVLSTLVRDVYTIEIMEPLGRRAKAKLEALGYKNVHAKIGDGYAGWPEHSPFDKIIVTCSPEQVPQPLVEQLREGGRLIVPLGERFQQMLHVMKKVDGKLVVESREPTFFVPMTGTARRQRSAEPVAAITSLVNGDFEHIADGQPAGWYYVRSCSVVPCDRAGQSGPDGHCLSFTNSVPGRACQSLQAFGVDGRQVSELEARVWVRSEDVSRGVVADQQPRLILNFCDENRVPVGQGSLGPWLDTSDWKHETGRMDVPLQARMATIGVGLLGGTGKLFVDAVEVDISQRR